MMTIPIWLYYTYAIVCGMVGYVGGITIGFLIGRDWEKLTNTNKSNSETGAVK